LKRTSIVKLILDKDTESKLKALCSLSSKLWNEVNYSRRRQFFEKKHVDLKGTYKQFYNRYKILIGSATVQQVLNKNNEAWKSFFALLKAKKEGKLPPFIKKINPPGYKKNYSGRVLWTVLRNDQYGIDGGKIIIRGLGALGKIEIRYKGKIHLKGKQGRMEIRYDSESKNWYAYITFEASEKLVKDAWIKIPLKPKGSLRAGIDIGINNLFAVYMEDGRTLLVSGRPLKAISHYWRHRIAEYQSTLNKYGLKTSHKLRKMYKMWRKQARHYINTIVRRLAEKLYHAGVSLVYIGYPKMVAQENGNFNTVHVWSYGYLIKRLVEVFGEYSIETVFVNEIYTSQTCPIHGNGCGKRVVRGLFKCIRLNKVFNADLVGAYNILVKGVEAIAPSPRRGIGVTGAETRPRAEQRDVAPNLPALAGTLAL